MNNDNKLGSEKNPIALIDHTSDKAKDIKIKGKRGVYWPRKGIDGTPFDRDFTAVKNSVTVDDAFILNVIQNPYLSPLDMRLAFYFYHKEMAANCHLSLGNGNTFIIDEDYSKKQLKKLIGSSGTLYYSTDVLHFTKIDEIIQLVQDLKNSNIDVGLTELKTSIQTLSDFAYITITPISWENAHVRFSRTAKKKISEDEVTRVYARNIRIFSRMGDKLIFKTIKEDP